MAKSILGIDIGYNSLKLALVNGKQIRHTAVVDMPENLLKDGRVVSKETMGELLRDTIKANNIHCTLGAVSLANESVFIRSVTMPVMTISQLASNLPFEFRDYITDELNNYVYDDELHSKINKLEKLFVTFFVFILVLMAFLSIVMRDGDMDESKVLLVILAWFVIDSLVVSPLIYYMAMPKPIKSHIHDVDKMTEEETEAVESARNKNERLERMLP